MITFLIGPRASGKSTIGRMFAQQMRQSFIDLDDVALAAFPEKTIREVWERHGETQWRSAESRALDALLISPTGTVPNIIALGGGAPMVPHIRQTVHEYRATGRAQTVYLRCAVVELRNRLQRDVGDRPSLTGQDVAAEIAQIVSEREPTYIALADVIIDTSGKLPADAVNEMVRKLK